jgi:phosphonate transport system permease protein
MAAATAAIPAPPRSSRRHLIWGGVIVAALVAVHVYAWNETDFSISALVKGWHGIVDFLGQALPPDLSVVGDGIQASLVTLCIGVLGTTLSIPFALALAVLGARTTAPNVVVYQSSRSLLSFLRAVPDVVFALIFVTAVGLGPFPGVLALIVHNTGVMGKLWSESIGLVGAGGIGLPDQPEHPALQVRPDVHLHPDRARAHHRRRPALGLRPPPHRLADVKGSDP